MKVLEKIWSVVSTIIVVIILALAVLLAGVRIVGLRPFAVLSGSMEPSYHVGSLIYVKPCDPEDVELGDPITFVLDEKLTVVTHRVIEIDEENEYFYTKGDANDAADGSPVYFPNLIGRPVFTIPYLGYISSWVTTPPGMYIAITAVVIFLILMFLPDALKKAEEADKRAAEKKARNSNNVDAQSAQPSVK
jgi:signal peptidase